MKLSTKTRYGTRAMVELALHYGQGPVTTGTIAECQQVSAKYLEQMLGALRRAGLVRATRGAHGGHSLARPPDEINLRDIYTVLEGADGLVDCATNPEGCQRHNGCVTQAVWARMHQACMDILESTTLKALADKAKEQRPAIDLYSI